MVKILICEDTVSSASRLVEEAGKDDLQTVVITDDFDRDFILGSIEEVVLRERPSYMILDGLNGRWKEAIEIARRAYGEIVPILYTSGTEMIEEAEGIGVIGFHKKSQQELDNMFMFIYKDSKRRGIK